MNEIRKITIEIFDNDQRIVKDYEKKRGNPFFL